MYDFENLSNVNTLIDETMELSFGFEYEDRIAYAGMGRVTCPAAGDCGWSDEMCN